MELISKTKLIEELQAFFPTVEGIQPETLFAQIRSDIQNMPPALSADEVQMLRKVMQCANMLYSVAETEYKENKFDLLLRKLREMENDNA